MTSHIELKVDKLLLDTNNPRLVSVESQEEALEALIELSVPYFRKMMLSIKKNGLDPGDSFYVIKTKGGNYIALEGNRRLAALKVLCDPDILNETKVSDSVKRSLQDAASGFAPDNIRILYCVLFPSRDDAKEWIERRHTGAAGGEGRIRWGPLEIQRFSGDYSILDIIEFVGRSAKYTDEEWASIQNMAQKKSTIIFRLLGLEPGRKHLGISIKKINKDTVPLLASDWKWALKVLMQVIEDVQSEKVNSRDLNKIPDIKQYFNKLPKKLQPQGKPGKPVPFRDINKGKTIPLQKKSPSKKVKAKRPRKGLAPKKHVFNNPASSKGQALLRDAGNVDADLFPYSRAFVLRAFLELALHDYMDKNGLPKEGEGKNGEPYPLSILQMAEKVMKDIKKTDKKYTKELNAFRKHMITSTSKTSVQSLNEVIHNKYHTPTADVLRAAWDSCIPIFIATYGEP